MAVEDHSNDRGDWPHGSSEDQRNSCHGNGLEVVQGSAGTANVLPSHQPRHDLTLLLSTSVIAAIYLVMIGMLGLSIWRHPLGWWAICIELVVMLYFVYVTCQLCWAVGRRSQVHTCRAAYCAQMLAFMGLFAWICATLELARVRGTINLAAFDYTLLAGAFLTILLLFAASLRMRRFATDLWIQGCGVNS